MEYEGVDETENETKIKPKHSNKNKTVLVRLIYPTKNKSSRCILSINRTKKLARQNNFRNGKTSKADPVKIK